MESKHERSSVTKLLTFSSKQLFMVGVDLFVMLAPLDSQLRQDNLIQNKQEQSPPILL